MPEKKVKEIKSVPVTFTQFSEWDFIPPGSYYVRNAMGDYTFYKTSKRADAQLQADKDFGVGKYSVIAAKLEKPTSRLESGEYSVRGTSTRRGQHRG